MPIPFRHFLIPALGLVAAVVSCKPPTPRVAAPPAAEKTNSLAKELALARLDLAKSKSPGEALLLLSLALKADPANEEARSAAEKLLENTTWNWPAVSLEHYLAIDQVAFSPPSSLWVSLSGVANSTVRWNLDSLKIEAMLFPIPGKEPTRSLTFDPSHRNVVVQRHGITLLCDARTLKPVRDLGDLPEFATPASAIAFSPDGLLVAHPAFVSDKDRSVVWQLKDAASGEIVRTSGPARDGDPQGLAAYLDRRALRILLDDGGLMEMPISPVDDITFTPAKNPLALLHAQFSKNGNSALALQNQGPHRSPSPVRIPLGGEDDHSLTPNALAERFSWNLYPSVWTGLLREQKEERLFNIEGGQLNFQTRQHATISAHSNIRACAVLDDMAWVGEESGTLTLQRLLPLPLKSNQSPIEIQFTEKSWLAMEKLAESLSGLRIDPAGRNFTNLSAQERMDALNALDPVALKSIFPTLDFAPAATAIRENPHRRAAPEELIPMWDRLALADASAETWPAILSLSKDLIDTAWHQNLTGSLIRRGEPADGLEKIFAQGDDAAVRAAIQSAGNKGPAAARALELALASEHPGWIQASLATAIDLPPLLLAISKSRIAWLQGRKANALAAWSDQFPVMSDFRLREDWDGWEQADFSPALDFVRKCVAHELLTLQVPQNSTAEQRKAVADRLKDPVTVSSIGKPRFAKACLEAALAFSAFKEDKETTFQLASAARQLGAPPEPCLRAEALALTALGDYQEAHPRWIQLITEHPVDTHLPGDYAEAAYTAFENADPQQAMEILTTGIHRFPEDGNFAIRAGWVALLTGNSERAYRFLQGGQRVGFPAEKMENATALLAIAASQSGAPDDASVYFDDLVKLSADWADPNTVETLDWPEELKSTLRELTR